MIVIDTDVIVAAMRSRTGASAGLLDLVLADDLRCAASVPMIFEYEAVLTRADHLIASGLDHAAALKLVDALAARVMQVETHFRWRPQLRDPGIELVLEAAVNARAEAIVTFNRRDFLPGATTFGIAVRLPFEQLEIVR